MTETTENDTPGKKRDAKALKIWAKALLLEANQNVVGLQAQSELGNFIRATAHFLKEECAYQGRIQKSWSWRFLKFFHKELQMPRGLRDTRCQQISQIHDAVLQLHVSEIYPALSQLRTTIGDLTQLNQLADWYGPNTDANRLYDRLKEFHRLIEQGRAKQSVNDQLLGHQRALRLRAVDFRSSDLDTLPLQLQTTVA